MESFARRRRAAPLVLEPWELRESQRARLLAAMATEACERGAQGASVARVVARAGVSRRTFYELFADSGDCLLAAIEQSIALASNRAEAAVEPRSRWVERMRAGLRALLELFDEQPLLPRLCLVQSLAAGPAAAALRGEVLARLAAIVDEGRAIARHEPPPLTAEGVVGGAASVVCARALAPQADWFAQLLGPLMSSIVLPYLGVQAARRELQRPPVPAPAKLHGPVRDHAHGPGIRLTYRTVTVLAAIAAQPGLTNAQVAQRAGIAHPSQISRLLSRLAGLALIESAGQRLHESAPHAWRLTRRGEVAMRGVRYERLPKAAAGFATRRPWTA
jgi:AcrR family transcriptional regulator